MRTTMLRSLLAGALAGAPAVVSAQDMAGYTLAPPAQRLTFAGVVADAAPEVQLMMALLSGAALASVALWATSLRRGDAKGLAGALGRLRMLRSGAAPLGFLTGAYVLFCMFLGVANVRPAPSLTILAPGFAEATLAIMLGLFAAAVAVICERDVETRIRRAAA